MLYFDANATSPPHPDSVKAHQAANERYWQNPSSPYSIAAKCHVLLEEARAALASKIRAEPEELIFNSGATEGNNSLFAWLANKHESSQVAVSAIEHPSVISAAKHWFPDTTITIPVDESGIVCIQALEKLLKAGTIALVSVMAANNETGVLQPWAEIAELSKKHGAYYHCDAVQWLGKMPNNNFQICDFVTGCAHKFGGPRGVGFMKAAKSLGFSGQLGGGQEHGTRSGTENYPAIAGMLAAEEVIDSNFAQISCTWANGRQYLENELKKEIPDIRIIGETRPRLPNTSCLLMPIEKGTRWVAKLDKEGVAISTGSACASGKTGASPILTAMSIEPEKAERSIRISATYNTKAEDWRILTKKIVRVYQSFLTNTKESEGSQVIRF